MKKGLFFILSMILVFIFYSCGGSDTGSEVMMEEDEKVDANTTPSIVNTEAAFKKALGTDGTWIIAALNDLTFTEDLVLEGEFTNRDQVDRKIALYTQDADRNVTARFTQTVPKLTVKSPNARIQDGIFVGDLSILRQKDFALWEQRLKETFTFPVML